MGEDVRGVAKPAVLAEGEELGSNILQSGGHRLPLVARSGVWVHEADPGQLLASSSRRISSSSHCSSAAVSFCWSSPSIAVTFLNAARSRA